MANGMEGFKICTFNCNGIADSKKRKDVFDFLRKLECNIYCLQETHLRESNTKFIRASWGFDIILSGRESNKNGVAILLNNNFEYKIHNVIKDPKGCFIVLDIEMLQKRYTIVNIYGSSYGDNPDFIEEPIEHVFVGMLFRYLGKMKETSRIWANTF